MSKDKKKHKKMKRAAFEERIVELQAELCKLQESAKQTGLRAIVVFEGRDAAGKGGVIKRIMERVSPRVFRLVALPAPTDREKTQIYAQRYFHHFPAAGEIVLFDRSWYNRAGVERVMGFCTEKEVERFFREVPRFERSFTDAGIHLIKYWFDVSREEQLRRFKGRMTDPRKHWKLSPMDLQSCRRWYDYSRARDAMLDHTDSEWAPWHVVPADDKRRARINCISHLLSVLPYKPVPFEMPKLPELDESGAYDDVSPMKKRGYVPDVT